MWGTKKQPINQAGVDNCIILGKNVTFKGLIYYEGTLHLDSYVEGEIYTNGLLVVSEHAVIRGTISVGTLISSGKIHGTVVASGKVRLLKSAVQIGDVHAPAFSIEEGAYFEGFADRCPAPSTYASSHAINRLPKQAFQHDTTTGLRLLERESDYEQLSHDLASDELVH